MCGICGFLGPVNREVLQTMNDRMRHRGPDAMGVFVDESRGVHLGHRRLSIVDIAGGGQPMWTPDGELGVVFNGEIYNHIELRTELRSLGHIFKSDHSDTEVLLHGFRQWGTDMFNQLNGMWSFALYDIPRRCLTLSRDRFGKKPLYYFARDGVFAFASELTALMAHPACPREIDRLALKKYFAYGYIPAPLSLLQGVHKLPGGHWLHLDLESGRHAVHAYWRFELEPNETVPARPEVEWGEQLRELLSRAVKRRLMSDVPLGVLLSGGVDSSAVAYYAVQHAGERVKTFAMGFHEPSFDETAWSTRMATFLDTDHTLSLLSIDETKRLLPLLPTRLDEPMGDSSLLPTALLCQETRRHVTVALGGDGSDELFAGYDPYKAIATSRWYDRLVPRSVHEGIRWAMAHLPVSHRRMSLDFKIKRFLRGMSCLPQLRLPVWMAPLGIEDICELFAEPCHLEEIFSEAVAAWDRCRLPSVIDKHLQFYTELYLQDNILTKADRASMFFALELRSPFLDIDVVDFIRKVPGEWKFRHGQTKYLLKKALEAVLPLEVLYRPKHGFGVPSGLWFKQGLLPLPMASNLVNSRVAARLAKAHRDGMRDERAFLWNLWLLEEWNAGNLSSNSF